MLGICLLGRGKFRDCPLVILYRVGQLLESTVNTDVKCLNLLTRQGKKSESWMLMFLCIFNIPENVAHDTFLIYQLISCNIGPSLAII